MRRLLGVLVVGGTLGGGCNGRVRPEDAPAEWTACKTDDECTAIHIGCCYCDEVFGVRKDRSSEALREMKADDCGDGCSGGCPDINCGTFVGECQEQKCVARQGSIRPPIGGKGDSSAGNGGSKNGAAED